jgi:hypothetical protein
MTALEHRYRQTYLPLLKTFAADLQPEEYVEIPELFLPLYGSEYENAKLKIAFVGRDTLSWGNMFELLNDLHKRPEDAVFRNLAEFQNLDFKCYMPGSGRNFWGFIFRIIAHLNKISNWRDLPNGQWDEILRRIAWGNTYALTNSSAFKAPENFSVSKFRELKKRSIPFDNFRHLYSVLDPDLVVLMNWQATEKRVAATDSNCVDTQLDEHIWHYSFR